jgi:succinate dehydrogenase/fumarate reductase cytochrome b subunit
MGKQNALAQTGTCFAPEINRLITAYCFGRTSNQERRALEVHLLECDDCWSEVQRLEVAVHALSSERGLIKSLSASDVVATFGLSSRLGLPFGGHLWHIVITCCLYVGLYVVMLLMEIAYRFETYGPTGFKLAPIIFLWIGGTSALALAIDWYRASKGKAHGLVLSLLVFLAAAGALFAALTLFLPDFSITESGAAAYPAQASYLKDICYSLLLVIIFWVPTFHFVVLMQRELHSGRYRLALELLSGGRFSVAPRGAIFPSFWLLALALMIMASFSAYLTTNLLDKLGPSPYKNLFINLMYLRLILHYGLGLKCLSWYYRAINELKRECLVAGKTKLT